MGFRVLNIGYQTFLKVMRHADNAPVIQALPRLVLQENIENHLAMCGEALFIMDGSDKGTSFWVTMDTKWIVQLIKGLGFRAVRSQVQ